MLWQLIQDNAFLIFVVILVLLFLLTIRFAIQFATKPKTSEEDETLSQTNVYDGILTQIKQRIVRSKQIATKINPLSLQNGNDEADHNHSDMEAPITQLQEELDQIDTEVEALKQRYQQKIDMYEKRLNVYEEQMEKTPKEINKRIYWYIGIAFSGIVIIEILLNI